MTVQSLQLQSLRSNFLLPIVYQLTLDAALKFHGKSQIPALSWKTPSSQSLPFCLYRKKHIVCKLNMSFGLFHCCELTSCGFSAFCLLTLKSSEKWRSPLFGATCNFRKSRDVTVSVSSIISALISCNVIIKNYVNRKITSYIYLLIFTKSLWHHVKHFIALTKTESVRRIAFLVITDQDYPCQHIDQWPRKTRESTTVLATKKGKKTCVHIKRVKSDSYLT